MQSQVAVEQSKHVPEFSNPSSKLKRRVWTRWEDGSVPVKVWENSELGRYYEVCRGKKSEFFDTDRKLLRAVTGRDCRLTFDAYFKLDQDRAANERPNVVVLLDQFRRRVHAPAPKRQRVKTKPVVLETQSPTLEFRRVKGGLRLTRGANETLVRSLVATFEGLAEEIRESIEGPKLGIDLANRGHEVRKLLFAGFRGQMASRGYDPEDVLQEIYAGLMTRNKGKCPWDGRKSTFGYYVTMVIRCVLTNYHRKMTRKLDREALELDESVYVPATSTSWLGAAGTDGMARESLEDWLKSQALTDTEEEQARLAVRLLPYVEQGMGRKEIVARTGLRETVVSKGLAYLRERAREWATEVGVTVRERARARRVVN